MVWILKRGNAEFFPFQDMRDVRQLILTPQQYQFFVDRLDWSLEREIEDGGLITVHRNGDSADVDEFYIAPDEFKTAYSVDIGKAERSEWYESLLVELKEKQQRMGFNYHIHSSNDKYGHRVGEEKHTARRTRDDLDDLEKMFMKKEERKLSIAQRRMGDIIVERLINGQILLQGYTPVTKPYSEESPYHILRQRETYSLEILVPELSLRFDSIVP